MDFYMTNNFRIADCYQRLKRFGKESWQIRCGNSHQHGPGTSDILHLCQKNKSVRRAMKDAKTYA
ncbi:MAG: hypothetical protein DRI57_29315 [Deltaproteobacteria bacterium]|nr:MAG: hypothetical protein DRI57_29315 [Deltaproteobacteria bacterium]